MPHLIIEYTANLEPQVDMPSICNALRLEMIDTGVFPIAGVRVRAVRVDTFAMADADPKNSFVHMQIRMGTGRDLETRQRAGEAIYGVARTEFAKQLETGFFALSLEINEINSDTSWKLNTVRGRLALKN